MAQPEEVVDHNCANCGNEIHWYPAINEEGWACCSCRQNPGEPPGYSPQLDRDLLERKIFGIEFDLSENNLIYISNGSTGEDMLSKVWTECRAEGLFDQATIISKIVAYDTDADFWKKIGDGVIAGKDPRARCACGALATVSGGDIRSCSEHYGTKTLPFEEAKP